MSKSMNVVSGHTDKSAVLGKSKKFRKIFGEGKTTVSEISLIKLAAKNNLKQKVATEKILLLKECYTAELKYVCIYIEVS